MVCPKSKEPIIGVVLGLWPCRCHMRSGQHLWSCENNPKKQQWIKDNFDMEKIFTNIHDLPCLVGLDCVTGKEAPVDRPDILVAGFVCKSVSTENVSRHLYHDCINTGQGTTGETFRSLLAYVEKSVPRVVICENVEGLVKRNRGEEPVIHHVGVAFRRLGYSFAYTVVDSRDYHVLCLASQRDCINTNEQQLPYLSAQKMFKALSH